MYLYFYNYEEMSVFTRSGGLIMLWVELRKGEMLELEDGIDGLKAFMKAAKYEQNTEDY